MKILHYCQHVLGMGHFFRSIEIASKLYPAQITFVSGGVAPQVLIPNHIKYVALPALEMNENFKSLHAHDNHTSLDQIKKNRSRLLLEVIQKTNPDVFLIELFPFGRKAFRFELIPALEEAKSKGIKVICSLRDILVERDDGGKHERRCVETLNKYFDQLLIHSDENLIKLEETFGCYKDIKIDVKYTGFVSRTPTKSGNQTAHTENEKQVIISAGGGRVGYPLMNKVLKMLKTYSCEFENIKFLFITGPYLDANKYNDLETEIVNLENTKLVKFVEDFPDILAKADCMISMAGYNTCMDILISKTPSIVFPFNQNHEQRLRAEKIATKFPLKIIDDNTTSKQLFTMLNSLLKVSKKNLDHSININGAKNSANFILKSHAL